MQTEFLAFVHDNDSFAAASAWAERQGFASSAVQQGDLARCADYFEVNMPPRLLIVDIDDAPEAVTVLGKLANRCGAGTKLIALGTQNDVGLYRQFLAAGVADYLIKPLTAELLSQAMAVVLRGDAAAAGGGVRDAKFIVFLGTRGGVGTSTLAINAAWLMAHELKKQVALVDLDLQFGMSALALDLEPGRGLRDLVSSPQRVDGLMITGSLATVGDHFAVLSAEEGVDDLVPVDGQAVTALLKEMRPTYDAVVVDLPRHMLPLQKRLLAAAPEIVLVSELSLVGIRDTLRVRTALKSLGCPARVTLVVAAQNAQHPPQVEAATFAKGVQARIDFTMPDDYKTVTAASNSGKSFVALAPMVPLTKAVRAVAQYLLDAGDDEDDETAKGGLLSWFGGKKAERKGAP
jgi:pilus assembly protein CpaE